VDEGAAGPLKGKRILLTRAAEQSRELVHAFEEQGALMSLLPLVEVLPPDDPAGLDQALRVGQSHDWVFLTSQNAVRALEERAALLGIALREAFAGVRIAAVGPATAQVAETAGLEVAYVAQKHQGICLADELRTHIEGKRVLLPRSDRSNPDLVERLQELGALPKEVIAYKTGRPVAASRAEAEAVLQPGVNAVLFFSPSAVQHFEEILGRERFVQLSGEAAFAAIGPVTAEALRKAGAQRVVLAPDTTVPALVAALANHFSEHEEGWATGARPR